MSGFVAAPDEYNKRNESAFRLWAEDEFALTFRRGQDLIIPYGTKLGFAGTNGQQVDFKYDSGSFQIVVDGVTVVSFTSSSDFSSLQSEVVAARQGQPNLSAKVTQLSTATSNLDGRVSAYYGVKVNAGTSVASLELLASGGGTPVSQVILTATDFIINGNTLVNGTVTANKLSVTSLDAITATIGLLRTATTGARMELESNQGRVYDSSNVLRVRWGIW